MTSADSTSETSWEHRVFAPVDGASSVFFRIFFGAIVAKWAWDYLEIGRVRKFYIEPAFNFSYYGFEWLQPWPGEWMTVHFVFLLLTAICVCIGFMYRFTSLLLAAGITYVFLLDRTNYQNHYYLMCLIAWWMPWLPLNRNVAVDAWLWPKTHSQTVPTWTLWVLQFHVAVPYFFGGIAKLTPDWLLGEPLTEMLMSQRERLPIIGEYLASQSLGLALSWGGLLFDLFIVPLLLWRKTRVIAFCMCIVFHLMNSVIFNIHIFPWFMLAATPIFFEPDWPRRVLGGAKLDAADLSNASESMPSTNVAWRNAMLAFMVAYMLFHCLWPLRHHLYPGDASWNERGHYFAWRMMLRGKKVVLGYAVTDKVTGQTLDGGPTRFLNPEQYERFGRDPEMILQFAHFLGAEYEKETGHEAEIHALVMASLNGRKPELMIDPNVDLLREPLGFYQRDWILPQKEPLRRPAWDMPPEQWRQHVEIPELRFMSRYKKSAPEQTDQNDE